MKTPAIQQAFSLKKHPKEMAWLCLPESEYPEGITDLLSLCASDSQLEKFADEYNLDARNVHSVLLYFINNVILVKGNSDMKLLGTDKFSTPKLRKLHYQLLMRIYHPDVNSSPQAKEYTGIITAAYRRLKNAHAVIEIKTTRQNSNLRKPPKSFYQATEKAGKHISNVKSAFAAVSALSIISLVAFAGHFYDPANPELTMSKSKTNTELQVAAQNSQDKLPEKTTESKFRMASFSATDEQQSTEIKLQTLVQNLESAYERGNVDTIKNILANSPEIVDQTDQQISNKLETLFEITSERKMLLYNFTWRNISGKMQGQGKFISRYQLKGENQWLTREGNAQITAQQSGPMLEVTHLELQNQSIEQ
ncbi:MAG: J domain-containing protein [Cocleimonas sp.]